MSKKLTQADLDQFCGSETFYEHWTRKLIYTEGVQYLAEKAGAYWLIDAIASYQDNLARDPMLSQFQVWELKVSDSRAVLTCKADSGYEPKICQNIEYTDFPLDKITLWVERGYYPTLLLPSEH